MIEQPLRGVEGNILSSSNTPHITIRVDDTFQYIGNLQFILSGTAQVEQFVFADYEVQKINRMFVAQFEGKLDGVNDAYNYSIAETLPLGAHEYMHESHYRDFKAMVEAKPDSDYARTDSFLREQGYSTPEYAIIELFVRLLGEAKRNEILFFYIEDLSYNGLSFSELSGMDKVSEEWMQISQELLNRSLESFEIIDG